MSIIAEALKKAEKDKDKTTTSKEYMNKIAGPARNATYQREKFKDSGYAWNGKILGASAALLILAAVFFTVNNTFFLPPLLSPVELETAALEKELLEAEAYTDMSSEIALLNRRIPVREEFLSKFALSGIVWDVKDSWAVVNDEIVMAGDVIGDAKILSIEPQKVTVMFKDEEFSLVVK